MKKLITPIAGLVFLLLIGWEKWKKAPNILRKLLPELQKKIQLPCITACAYSIIG